MRMHVEAHRIPSTNIATMGLLLVYSLWVLAIAQPSLSFVPLKSTAITKSQPLFVGHVDPRKKATNPSFSKQFSSKSSDQLTTLWAVSDAVTQQEQQLDESRKFDMATALFCGGLAFDAYSEPPANSSRWERGSQGMNVAFQSAAFTRSLYKGLIEVTPIKCTDLPDEDDTAESLLSGGGVDAYLLVAAVEGGWKEDVKMLEEEQFNEGVLDLLGAAHVGRGDTAWSNIDEAKAKRMKKQGTGTGSYHIKSTWGRGGQAIWDGSKPFYLYIQDPSTVRLVFTVMDDDVVGDGDPVGSAHRRLSVLIPAAAAKNGIEGLKAAVLTKLKKEGGEVKNEDIAAAVVQEWEGDIKLSSKPRLKDKKGQVAMGAAAGAMVAGPVGAAVGGFMANLYEGEVRGRLSVKLRYLPIPQSSVERKKYLVKGGLPGVSWGELYDRFVKKQGGNREELSPDDLEFCFFINHDKTGCSCALYRSLEKKIIAISFRGTCNVKDLLTDASIAQSAWVEGEDVTSEETCKVHMGFRNSLSSVARRLKELLLAAVAPGEELSQYDVLITGHSLGGALATLFAMDIAEYGVDAGRSLPQLAPSEPWWNSVISTIRRTEMGSGPSQKEPPRPKSLRLYSFGSPRVGNSAFATKFDSLIESGKLNEAYRIVNGDDIVARLPRTVNALVLGNIGYEHCGPTALISVNGTTATATTSDPSTSLPMPSMWVEGESSDEDCPVRDGKEMLQSPLASSSLLGQLMGTLDEEEGEKTVASAQEESKGGSVLDFAKFGKMAEKVTGRLQKMEASDLTSIVGINKKFAEREMRIIQTLFSGDAIGNHMEDQYYLGMGMIGGFLALVGEELKELDAEDLKAIRDADTVADTIAQEVVTAPADSENLP